MTRNARIAGYSVGAALLAGGITLSLVDTGGGIGLLILGTLVTAGIALEPRYGRPHDTARPSGTWERTGERFVDDESGELVEVWYNPATGERRYTQVDR